MHQKAVELQRKSEAEHLGEKYTKKLTPSGSTAIGDSIRSMGELTHEQKKNLEKLFHIAYFIGYKGRPYTDFMDLLELEKLHEVKFFKTSSYENESACRDFVSFCSKTIFHKTVKDKLERAFSDEGMGYLLQRTVFLASDGASVNTGVKNGLISLIREETPWVGFVWCFAHRLELALKDALKEWI